jgi:cytochrome c oxidase cbb3-type subunit 3
MNDSMSNFWHWFIVLPTLLGLAGCYWLLHSNRRGVESDQQADDQHVWDEDLTEYNNPLPRWWLNLFVITLVFALIYLLLYPGLGRYKGLLGYTTVGEYESSIAAAEQRYGPIYQQFAATPVEDLAEDPQALATGRRLFSTYCSTCHGSDARGSSGFPNLRDEEWLYGGTPEAISTTLTLGRSGVMPGWSAALSEYSMRALVEYVQSLHSGEGDDQLLAEGKAQFNTFCIACHGPQGKGQQALGAPDLTNDIWLYGGSQRALMETIRNGRNGKMPAHGEFLGANKIHLLTAYIYSLSRPVDSSQ